MAEENGGEGVTPGTGESPTPSGGPTPADVERLTKALEREREQRKTFEQEAKAGRDAAQRLAQLEESTQTETEKALAKARAEAARETEQAVTARFTGLLLRSAVVARAAGSFADPEDALTVDLDGLALGEDGGVDTAEVDRRLAELLERKPHWRKPSGPRFGNVGQGGQDSAAPMDPRQRDIWQIEQDIKESRASRRGA